MFHFSRTTSEGHNTIGGAARTIDDRNPSPETGRDEHSGHLRVLGLSAGASSAEIQRAHARLVADLTPGPDASHRNVALAKALLDEVNLAFDSLRLYSVA